MLFKETHRMRFPESLNCLIEQRKTLKKQFFTKSVALYIDCLKDVSKEQIKLNSETKEAYLSALTR